MVWSGWSGMVGMCDGGMYACICICVSHAASLSLRALVTFRMKPDAGTTSCRATTAAKATATEEPLYINERCIYVLYYTFIIFKKKKQELNYSMV